MLMYCILFASAEKHNHKSDLEDVPQQRLPFPTAEGTENWCSPKRDDLVDFQAWSIWR